MQRVYETGITTTDELLEKCGLGYFFPIQNRRLFFKADLLTKTSSSKVIPPGQTAIVKSGSINIGGITYDAGDLIPASGVTVDLSAILAEAPDNIVIGLWFPEDMLHECERDAECYFRQNILYEGDEALGYWDPLTGYKARNSTNPNDTTFVGWIRD